jgi:hypothetical protein
LNGKVISPDGLVNLVIQASRVKAAQVQLLNWAMSRMPFGYAASSLGDERL